MKAFAFDYSISTISAHIARKNGDLISNKVAATKRNPSRCVYIQNEVVRRRREYEERGWREMGEERVHHMEHMLQMMLRTHKNTNQRRINKKIGAHTYTYIPKACTLWHSCWTFRLKVWYLQSPQNATRPFYMRIQQNERQNEHKCPCSKFVCVCV